MLPFKRSIEAGKKFNLRFKENQAFEFFFYADREDDADNLAICLHALGYTIYERTFCKELPAPPFSVIGHTTLLPTSENHMDNWCLEMEQIAEENKCRFDGWGTLME